MTMQARWAGRNIGPISIVRWKGEVKIAMVKKKAIRAYQLDEELVCKECITKKEQQDLRADDTLTNDDLHDDLLLTCDRCKRQIEKHNRA
jgi:hypothetical protein